MCRNKLLFEYRVFGQDFGEAQAKLYELGKQAEATENYDYYILSEGNTRSNILIRNKRLVIKELISIGKKLEKWNVNQAEPFPLSKEFVENVFFPAVGIEAPNLERESYEILQFIEEIINADPDLKLVEVYKKKTEFIYNNCNCEIAENLINGAFIRTFNIESEVVQDVYTMLEYLGINGEFKNTNYPMIIRQIIGLEPLVNYKL